MKEMLWILKIFELDIEMNAWGFYFLYPIFVVYGIKELCVWPVFMNRDSGPLRCPESQTKLYLRGSQKGGFYSVKVKEMGMYPKFFKWNFG